jgi:hypothetical protein
MEQTVKYKASANGLQRIVLTNIKLADGSLANIQGTAFDNSAIGQEVYLAEGADDFSLLPAGIYHTADNVAFMIGDDGKLKNISNVQKQPAQPAEPLQFSLKQFKEITLEQHKTERIALNEQLNAEVATLWERTDKSMSFDNFKKLYEPSKPTSVIDFDRIGRQREVNENKPGANMKLTVKDNGTWLTDAQKAAAKNEMDYVTGKTTKLKMSDEGDFDNNLTTYDNKKLKAEGGVKVGSKVSYEADGSIPVTGYHGFQKGGSIYVKDGVITEVNLPNKVKKDSTAKKGSIDLAKQEARKIRLAEIRSTYGTQVGIDDETYLQSSDSVATDVDLRIKSLAIAGKIKNMSAPSARAGFVPNDRKPNTIESVLEARGWKSK